MLETPTANCSAFMQSLLTSYTSYFNLCHGRHGNLFDGRFKAKLVEGDEYLLALSRYVHLNPVRVSGLDDPAEQRELLRSYHWSSYLQYIGRRKKLDFLTSEPTLSLLSAGKRRGSACRQFVEQGLASDEDGLGEPYPLSIGSGTFHDWVRDKYLELVASISHQEDVCFRRGTAPLRAEEVLGSLASVLDCELDTFRRRRHGMPHRSSAAHFLTRYAGLSRREVATHLA